MLTAVPEHRLNDAQIILTNLFARGKTQKDVAEVLGISQAEISKVYTGKKSNGTAYDGVLRLDAIYGLLRKQTKSSSFDNSLEAVLIVTFGIVVLLAILFFVLNPLIKS